MNGNEVNEVINNICEKIGIGINSAKEFVPLFTKYKVIDSAFTCIGFLVITVIFIILARKESKSYKEADEWDKDAYAVGAGGSVLASLVFGGMSLWKLFTMIEWLVVPEAMTVQYILSMMK